jgi:hypothetical protein
MTPSFDSGTSVGPHLGRTWAASGVRCRQTMRDTERSKHQVRALFSMFVQAVENPCIGLGNRCSIP